MLDIRLPIGAMFLAIGLLLFVYGLVTPAEMYKMSLGYNLNLIWGAVMAAFGAAMLAWMRFSPYHPSSGPGPDA